MTKIIDGAGAIMGRLASLVAKDLLKGEEVVILNCERVIITGNKSDIKKNFEQMRSRFGSSQKGPKHPKVSEIMVKRTIRGMLPNHREGRGREAFAKLKCYRTIPAEFENKKAEKIITQAKKKFAEVKEFTK